MFFEYIVRAYVLYVGAGFDERVALKQHSPPGGWVGKGEHPEETLRSWWPGSGKEVALDWD